MVRAVVALLVLMVPLASAEGDLSALQLDGAGRYLVAWDLVESRAPFAGSLDLGASRNIVIQIPDPNLVDVRVDLRWTETHDKTGVTADDTFEVAIESPDGESRSERSASGGITVESGVVNEAPEPFEMDAESVSTVLDAVEREETTLGSGGWTVSVKLVDAGNPKGTKVDTGNTYDLVVTATRYVPMVTRVVSLNDGAGLTAVDAVTAARSPWTWTAGLLGMAALGLGAFVVRDAARRRS